MRIESTTSTSPTHRTRRERHEAAGAAREAARPEQSRAVLPLQPTAERTGGATRHRGAYAPLLAHLIATKLEFPQTRERRRASPATAIDAYAATGADFSTAQPTGFYRSV